MPVNFKSNIIVKEADDLSKYGKDFQVKLLSLLIKDRPFALGILPIIKDIYFTDVYLRTVYAAICSYIEKYKSTPTIDNVKIILTDAGEKPIVYEKILKSINNIGLEDRDFVIANTTNFCFTKYALIEQEKVTNALKAGQFEIAKKIALESFRYSGNETAKEYDLQKDYEIIFEDEILRAPVPTPMRTFNKNMKGGPGAGDLCLIIAASNFGKSAYAQAVARQANFDGKNVVYISYEMDGAPILSRYIAGLVDIPQEELKLNKDVVDRKLADKGLGLLRIIKDKSSNATISIIRSHIERLKSTGFFPQLMIIDGLNQVKLEQGKWAKDDNTKYEILSEELKDLAGDFQIPCWACWQGNRSSFSSELNDIKTIGKAIEVFQKADVVITFSQTAEQKENKECIAYLLKNRLGVNEICLLCGYDPNKGLFIERYVVNPRVLLSDNEKRKVTTKVTNVINKLKSGQFDSKVINLNQNRKNSSDDDTPF